MTDWDKVKIKVRGNIWERDLGQVSVEVRDIAWTAVNRPVTRLVRRVVWESLWTDYLIKLRALNA